MTVGELKEFLKDVDNNVSIDFAMGDTSQSKIHHNLNPIFTSMDNGGKSIGIGVSVDIDQLIEDRRYDTLKSDL